MNLPVFFPTKFKLTDASLVEPRLDIEVGTLDLGRLELLGQSGCCVESIPDWRMSTLDPFLPSLCRLIIFMWLFVLGATVSSLSQAFSPVILSLTWSSRSALNFG